MLKGGGEIGLRLVYEKSCNAVDIKSAYDVLQIPNFSSQHQTNRWIATKPTDELQTSDLLYPRSEHYTDFT